MKKVLIVTYYWPPSGGSGVQRWLKFAKYLPAFGWKPIIFTPKNPDFQIQDPTLDSDLPSEIEVVRYPIWEPYGIFKKLRGERDNSNINQGKMKAPGQRTFLDKLAIWIRGNLLIPDPRIFWVKPAVRFLKKYIKEQDIHCVITTSPPHSMHLIGLGLKKRVKDIRWLVDLRDPWSEWDMLATYQTGRLAARRHKRLEKKVLKNADRVITVSKTWAEDFQKLGGRPVDVITNGFDRSDFAHFAHTGTRDRFRINHIGLLNELRNPMLLWESLEELCQADISFAADLEVYLAGLISDEIIRKFDGYPSLKNKLIIDGYIPHPKALEAYHKAAVLLLILNDSDNARGHIPGKIFEYLASNTPVLALGPAVSDTAQIITATGGGVICENHDKKMIKAGIITLYEQYKAQAYSLGKEIQKFDRKELTSTLAVLLKSMCEGK